MAQFKLAIDASTGESKRVQLTPGEVTKYNEQQTKSLAGKVQEVIDNAAKNVRKDGIKAKLDTIGINFDDLKESLNS